MKSLFTILLLIPALWMIELPQASAAESKNIRHQPSMAANPGDDHLNPVFLATSWKGSGKYGYYGRGDHRHRGHPYFDKHRHRHTNPRFHGHRHFRAPHKPHPFHFHDKRFFHRPHRGGHFGFTTCYRSGSVLVCVNKSHPHRFR